MNRALQLSCTLMLALLQQPQLVAETKTMSLSNAAKLTGADEEVQQLFTAAAALHSSLKNVPSTGVSSSLSRCRSCSCPGCSRQKTAVGAKIGWRPCASSSPGIGMTGRTGGCNTTLLSRFNLPRHGLTQQQTPAAGCDPARSCSERAGTTLLQELHPNPRRTPTHGRGAAAPRPLGFWSCRDRGTGNAPGWTPASSPAHAAIGKTRPTVFRLSSSAWSWCHLAMSGCICAGAVAGFPAICAR